MLGVAKLILVIRSWLIELECESNLGNLKYEQNVLCVWIVLIIRSIIYPDVYFGVETNKLVLLNL